MNSIATDLTDDNICQFILSEATTHNVVLYVVTEELPSADFIEFSFPETGTSSQICDEVGIIPLLPPPFRRRTGRPRTTRIRNTMDEARASSGRARR